MPRYDLSDRDMEILIHYLRNLSSQLSPGASDKVIHFATVITDEVRAEDREAMLLPLQNYITQHNRIALNFDTKMYVFGNGPEMMLGYRQLSLDTWVLKGAPSTWRRQLEAYQKQKPAFALLGGISYQDWKPIHDFCETRQIPCLFPITDYPVISETDWYTLYLSKGLQQESQAAARYLKNVLPEGQVLQVVQDSPQGRALAAGFQAAWAEVGGAPVQSVPLPPKAGAGLSARPGQEGAAPGGPAVDGARDLPRPGAGGSGPACAGLHGLRLPREAAPRRCRRRPGGSPTSRTRIAIRRRRRSTPPW